MVCVHTCLLSELPPVALNWCVGVWFAQQIVCLQNCAQNCGKILCLQEHFSVNRFEMTFAVFWAWLCFCGWMLPFLTVPRLFACQCLFTLLIPVLVPLALSSIPVSPACIDMSPLGPLHSMSCKLFAPSFLEIMHVCRGLWTVVWAVPCIASSRRTTSSFILPSFAVGICLHTPPKTLPLPSCVCFVSRYFWPLALYPASIPALALLSAGAFVWAHIRIAMHLPLYSPLHSSTFEHFCWTFKNISNPFHFAPSHISIGWSPCGAARALGCVDFS